MKPCDLLADYLQDQGFAATIAQIPMDLPSSPIQADWYYLIMISTAHSDENPKLWSSAHFDSFDGRLACTMNVAPSDFSLLNDPNATRVFYLDNPDSLPSIVAWLDHWYFRLYQQD